MTEHTADCIRARAGHVFSEASYWVGEDDPYPLLGNLSREQRAAIYRCPHADHDVVRLFVGLVGRP